MNSLDQKYNRFLIFLISLSPFLAYFTITFLEMEFNAIMQLLSFLGVLLLLVFRNKSHPLKFPRYLFFYFLFIVYIFYSTFIQLDRDFKIKYIYGYPLIGAFNFLFIVENLRISKKFYTHILSISKVILIIAVLVIIIQQVINPGFFIRMDNDEINEIIGWGETENRLLSIYSWLFGYLPIGFGFVPIFILVVEELYKEKKKVFIWILMGFLFVFLSKARWIMLNFILVFPVFLFNHKSKKKQVLKFLLIAPFFLILTITVLQSTGINAKGILHERILEDQNNGKAKTASTRLLAVQAFNKFFWDNSLFGKGDIKFGMGGTGKQDYQLRKFLAGRSSQIHVGYLSLLYMYGIIGGSMFLAFLYFLLRKLYNDSKKMRMWSPFLAILGFALANTSLVTFNMAQMGLIIAMFANKYYTQEEKNVYNN